MSWAVFFRKINKWGGTFIPDSRECIRESIIQQNEFLNNLLLVADTLYLALMHFRAPLFLLLQSIQHHLRNISVVFKFKIIMYFPLKSSFKSCKFCHFYVCSSSMYATMFIKSLGLIQLSFVVRWVGMYECMKKKKTYISDLGNAFEVIIKESAIIRMISSFVKQYYLLHM